MSAPTIQQRAAQFRSSAPARRDAPFTTSATLPTFGQTHTLADRLELSTRKSAPTAKSASLQSTQAVSKTQQVRFGAGTTTDRKNGVWVTTDRGTGGLGTVSKTIPFAIAEHSDKDMRVIQPHDLHQQKLKDGNDYKETGLSFKLTIEGKEYTFDILERFEPFKEKESKGNWVYSIKSTPLFDVPNICTYPTINGERVVTSETTLVATKPEFTLPAIFSLVATDLLSVLNKPSILTEPDETKLSDFEKTLKRRLAIKDQSTLNDSSLIKPGSAFKTGGAGNSKGNLEYVIINDWLSAFTANEMRHDPALEEARRLFMIHNSYDGGGGDPSKTSLLGLTAYESPPAYKTQAADPPEWKNSEPLPTYINAIQTPPAPAYQALEVGLLPADAIIGNHYFIKTITDTPFARGEKIVDNLKRRIDAEKNGYTNHILPYVDPSIRTNGIQKPKTIWDIHHGTDINADPYNSPVLTRIEVTKPDGTKATVDYKTLQNTGDFSKDIQEFKAANKQALQIECGLEQKSDAVVMSWAARLDPDQKGISMVLDAIPALVEKYPKLQFVIGGKPNENDKATIKKCAELTNTYKGRVYIPCANLNSARAMAGSDFTLLPSLYEPYGQTQLEALRLGSIPLVNPVDGILDSTCDPFIGDNSLEAKALRELQKDGGKGRPWQGADGSLNNAADTDLRRQTAIMMKPVDIVAYRRALNHERTLAECKAFLDKNATQKPRQLPNGLQNEKGYHPSDDLNQTSQTRKNIQADGTAKIQALLSLQRDAYQAQLEKNIRLEQQAATNNTPPPVYSSQYLKSEIAKIQTIEASGQLPVLTMEWVTSVENALKDLDNEAKENYKKSFIGAVDRAIELPTDLAKMNQIRQQGMTYVEKQHSWKAIAERYVEMINDNASLRYSPKIIDSEQYIQNAKAAEHLKNVPQPAAGPGAALYSPPAEPFFLVRWWGNFTAFCRSLLPWI